MLITLVLGSFVGAVLGLTGAGGGILAVPALVLGMGWPIQKAAPVALIAVASSTAIGAIEALRRHLVRYRAAVVMATAGAPLTSIGVRVAQVLSQQWLITLFAAVMMVVAARLFRQALAGNALAKRSSHFCVGQLNPHTGRFVWNWSTGAALTATGALTGLMTGLLGVGGGFVIVPMLRRFTNLSMHGIVATSLMVIALVGSASVLSSLLEGTDLPGGLTLQFSLATIIGMVLGRFASHRLPSRAVQLGFATVVFVVAIGMMVSAALGFFDRVPFVPLG